MRPIGIHIRLQESILEAPEYAHKLNTPIFQCFLIDQIKKRPIKLDNKTMKTFNEHRSSFHSFFIHGSYFINPAHLKESGKKSLKREIALAKQIGAPYFILHSGSATGSFTQKEGIEHLAKVINQLIADEPDILFLLENTAHGGKSVGSDLRDFARLKMLLDTPERIGFCIDTAHAHAYGYDLSHEIAQEKFIDHINETIGLSYVKLIHLNDAFHERGSRIDKHAAVGTGTIGADNLKQFILNPRLAQIPLILELPLLPYEQEVVMLQQVKDWHSSLQ